MDRNELNKSLCLSLLNAESEEKVINILRTAGYWDNPNTWRLYGDKEGNFATAGGQQASPEAAFVEKIVNSIDATLLRECMLHNINPESEEAPKSINEAVAEFFHSSNNSGDLRDWTTSQLTEIGKTITVAATGTRKYVNLTVADQGEGQMPSKIPDTIVSLNKKNKQKIRFVQGKFNMGGTGVLRHCGKHSLQLIITKRHPKLIRNDIDDDSKNLWGFTVVRRERPSGAAGEVIHSEFKYLAPNVNEDNKKQVLTFSSDTLPILPQGNKAYVRNAEWGTTIKLYNYDMSSGISHILMGDGLLYRLEALLPKCALPARLYECRDYSGKEEASFETNLNGLIVRLERGRGDNLELEAWDTIFTVKDLDFSARIYIFKRGKKKSYLRDEGILFTINGQTHGIISERLFSRKKVGLSRIYKDILVIVDCSDLPVDSREDLFMSSRDRLSDGELRKALESQLEEIIGNDKVLRSLNNKRREEEISEKLSDDKPLQDILQSIINDSPSLSALFSLGKRLSLPQSSNKNQAQGSKGQENEGGNAGPNSDGYLFVGKKHPTYFYFENNKKNEYERPVEIGRNARIAFLTDVENGYFSRINNKGRYSIEVETGQIAKEQLSYSCNLHDGIAQLTVNFPNHLLSKGDKVVLKIIIDDDVLLEPLVNYLTVLFKEKAKHEPGESKNKKNKGKGTQKGDKGESKLDLSLPNHILVEQNDKYWDRYNFSQETGSYAIDDADPEQRKNGHSELTFYINIDNVYLREEMKHTNSPDLVQKKFIYGNILIGMAIARVRDEKIQKTAGLESYDIEEKFDDYIRLVTTSLSPFIIPMIDSLGGLTDDDINID